MEQIFKLKISKFFVKDWKKYSQYMSLKYQNKMIKELNKKISNLRQMPKMYQRLYYEEKTHIDYRRCICENYIVIYKIEKNQITILRIISEKENYLQSKFFSL